MKIKNFLLSIPLLLALSGCLTVTQREYKFDSKAGTFEVVYHNVQSIKGGSDGPEYMDDDWKFLQESLNKKDDYRPEVISVKSKELFQEKDVLSAKAGYLVQCPKCFPSKVDILKMLHQDDLRWEIINDEIFLILPAGKLAFANGKIINTEKNTLVAWPESAEIFEYTINENQINGTSLLNRYLQSLKK